MLIFKKKINIVILVIISIITVIPLMINGEEFIPLSFGHLFVNFYFLFLWLIFKHLEYIPPEICIFIR